MKKIKKIKKIKKYTLRKAGVLRGYQKPTKIFVSTIKNKFRTLKEKYRENRKQYRNEPLVLNNITDYLSKINNITDYLSKINNLNASQEELRNIRQYQLEYKFYDTDLEYKYENKNLNEEEITEMLDSLKSHTKSTLFNLFKKEDSEPGSPIALSDTDTDLSPKMRSFTLAEAEGKIKKSRNKRYLYKIKKSNKRRNSKKRKTKKR